MSKNAISRSLGLLPVLVLTVVMLPLAAAQQAPRSHAQSKLALAADTIVREGVHASLPPHISTLLGVASEAECPVMQRAVHTGTLVQGFDVSVTNRNDIVIFVVDEAANNQDLYLTSSSGTLRRVVSVTSGVGHVIRITAKEQEGFTKEKQFWINRLAPSAATK